ncbi:hypothetical protein HPB49_022577 [Dermacentor silvarum]|uniref:Uncharacterized protein n=1 Tax=Dermacentor silvarum TaxID=543639 RepID=A0ACB8DRJ2_DERSI|nr:hypothetical protein HPB49_022577 [Dermacentor silvarum]
MQYGLTKMQVRSVAYQFATALNWKYQVSWEINKVAGRGWFMGFIHRHPELSLRSPEATSLGGETSFNKNNVDAFLSNLEGIYDPYKQTPERIYNCDKTGFTTAHNPPKIVAARGEKQIVQVTSADRGELLRQSKPSGQGHRRHLVAYTSSEVLERHRNFGATDGGDSATGKAWQQRSAVTSGISASGESSRPYTSGVPLPSRTVTDEYEVWSLEPRQEKSTHDSESGNGNVEDHSAGAVTSESQREMDLRSLADQRRVLELEVELARLKQTGSGCSRESGHAFAGRIVAASLGAILSVLRECFTNFYQRPRLRCGLSRLRTP